MNSNWSCCPETPNLGQIRWFLELCDLEIWRMTLKNNRAPLLCYFKLYASFPSHRWIQAGVTVRKRPIWVKIDDFFSCVTLQFDIWPWTTIGHLFYATSRGSNSVVFIAVWPWNLKDDLENNRAPLLRYFKLWASFRSHLCIQTGVTVRKRPIWVKINDF